MVIGDQYHSIFHKITVMGDINCHDDGVPTHGPDVCRGKGTSSHYRHISMAQRNYKRYECHWEEEKHNCCDSVTVVRFQ